MRLINKMLILSVVVLVVAILPTISFSETPNSAYIYGQLKNIRHQGKFKVTYLKEYVLFFYENKVNKPVAVDNSGLFSIGIPSIDEPVKMNMYIDGENYYFIVEPGDSVYMTMTSEEGGLAISFTGRGARKYECRRKIDLALEVWNYQRSKIGKIIVDSVDRVHDETLNYGDVKMLARLFEPFRTAQASTFQILEEYKSEFSPVVYQVMKADVLGRLGSIWQQEMALFFSRLHSMGNFKKSEALRLVNYYNSFFDAHFSDKVISMSKSLVHGYVSYLLYRANLIASIESNFQGYRYKSLYLRLKSEYSGYLRESVLSYYILSPFHGAGDRKEDMAEFGDCALDAYNLIETPSIKVLIGRMRNRMKGVEAYDFSLPSAKNDIIRLSDFREKVVLMDFWFTGCTGCLEFASRFKREIHPFIKDNPKFSVVSVNTDEQKEMWLSSLKGGRYSENDFTNVNTDGLGFFNHPMIKHYALSGAPFLLLIDKNGRIYEEISPGESSERILEVIMKALSDKKN